MRELITVPPGLHLLHLILVPGEGSVGGVHRIQCLWQAHRFSLVDNVAVAHVDDLVHGEEGLGRGLVDGGDDGCAVLAGQLLEESDD